MEKLQCQYGTVEEAKQARQNLIEAWHYPEHRDAQYSLDMKKKVDNVDSMLLQQGWVPVEKWLRSDDFHQIVDGEAEILHHQYTHDTIRINKFCSEWYYDKCNDWEGSVNWNNVVWVRMKDSEQIRKSKKVKG